MTQPIDPMSAEAQAQMDAFAAIIVARAVKHADAKKKELRALNDQRLEE